MFDSGVGGLASLDRLRQLLPNADFCYLADKANAPYGIKTEKELIPLVIRDIERLLEVGCERVLIACCTASTLHSKLPRQLMEISFPIILPAAERAAELSASQRVGVICTDFTKGSLAFDRALAALGCEAVVVSSRELVRLAELGVRDGAADGAARDIIRRELSPLFGSGCDTLILGCTHFTHIQREIEKILGIKTVSAATVGAEKFALSLDGLGDGKTIFLE